ncbi:MAG: tRNA pseudouridine(38-40) synthase TruA [Bdellovibrionales bacterium]|nr:tRNA pseudouridine(38-40) synthase TruA [Bdellovibrionales bacterium]
MRQFTPQNKPQSQEISSKNNEEPLESLSNGKWAMVIAYDGTNFGGWQKQKVCQKPTLQGTFEDILSRIFSTPIQVVGASRTDAGVHAWGQVAHFKVPHVPKKLNLLHALNSMCPEGVRVRKLVKVPDSFHAIASAQCKTYRYLIHNHQFKHPFFYQRTTWVREPLHLEFLNQLAQVIVGQFDFKSFQTKGSYVGTTVRRIDHALWKRTSSNRVEFSITGNGFLKQMVRNLVGTMLDIHYRQEPIDILVEILKKRDRQAARQTAAPQGLYLMKVNYPQKLDNKYLKL